MHQKIEEEEIDLRDYLNVIIKRKKIIIGIFVVSVLAAAFMIFRMPKTYNVSMSIEPANLGVTDTGQILYLDSIATIKAKIESGSFNTAITKALKLDPKKERFDFKFLQPKGTVLLKIDLSRQREQTALGLKILNELFTELSNSYKPKVQNKKEAIEKQISISINRIEKQKNNIELKKKTLQILEEREVQLVGELKNVKDNSEKLVAQRDNLLNIKGQSDDMAVLLYSNVVQQNISYFNNLNIQLAVLMTRRENTLTAIENESKEIDNAQINIEKLKLAKANIHNIKFVQKPEVSVFPIELKKKQNIAIASILSLILGVFIAFLVEFWEKEKK